MEAALRGTGWTENTPSCLGLQTPCTLWQLMADIWEQSQISPDQVTQVPSQVPPSWELEQPTICHPLGESLSKESGPLYPATLVMERTKEQLGNHLQIFMDSSVLESGGIGCAFVITDLKITRHYRLPAGTSIFTAELYAILVPPLPPPLLE